MNKFTPGPWDIHENVTLEIHPLDDEDGVNIIAEIPADAPQSIEIKRANARAIALLPELYEACKSVPKIVETLMDELAGQKATDWGIVNDGLVKISQICAKIEGGVK